MGRIAVLDSRSMEESGKKKKKKEEWRRRGGSVRRGVGSRPFGGVSGPGPPSVASALSVSGGGRMRRRKKYARSLAAANRCLIAAAAPGGCDREPGGAWKRRPTVIGSPPASPLHACHDVLKNTSMRRARPAPRACALRGTSSSAAAAAEERPARARRARGRSAVSRDPAPPRRRRQESRSNQGIKVGALAVCSVT